MIQLDVGLSRRVAVADHELDDLTSKLRWQAHENEGFGKPAQRQQKYIDPVLFVLGDPCD